MKTALHAGGNKWPWLASCQRNPLLFMTTITDVFRRYSFLVSASLLYLTQRVKAVVALDTSSGTTPWAGCCSTTTQEEYSPSVSEGAYPRLIAHMLAATFLWGTIIISYVTEINYPRDAVDMYSTQCGGCEELQQRPRGIVSHYALVILSYVTDS